MSSTMVITNKPKATQKKTQDNHYQDGWKTLWNQLVNKLKIVLLD